MLNTPGMIGLSPQLMQLLQQGGFGGAAGGGAKAMMSPPQGWAEQSRQRAWNVGQPQAAADYANNPLHAFADWALDRPGFVLNDEAKERARLGQPQGSVNFKWVGGDTTARSDWGAGLQAPATPTSMPGAPAQPSVQPLGDMAPQSPGMSMQIGAPLQPPVRVLDGGGPLDPNGINIVGGNGLEMVVGNTVIPFGIGGALDASGAFGRGIGGGIGGAIDRGMWQQGQPATQPQPRRQPSAQPQQPQQGGGQPPAQPPAQQGAFGPSLGDLLGGNFGNFGFGQPQMPQQVSDWLSAQLQGNIDYTMRNLTSAFPSVFNSAGPQLAGDILGRMVSDAGAQTSQAALQALGLDTDRNRAITERGLGVGSLGAQMTGLGIQQELGRGQLAQQNYEFTNNYALQQQQAAFMQWLQTQLPMIMAMLQQGTPTAPQTVVGG